MDERQLARKLKREREEAARQSKASQQELRKQDSRIAEDVRSRVERLSRSFFQTMLAAGGPGATQVCERTPPPIGWFRDYNWLPAWVIARRMRAAGGMGSDGSKMEERRLYVRSYGLWNTRPEDVPSTLEEWGLEGDRFESALRRVAQEHGVRWP